MLTRLSDTFEADAMGQMNSGGETGNQADRLTRPAISFVD
jgi:hypothetical protein